MVYHVLTCHFPLLSLLVDSEGNINPYATFRYPHHQVGFLPPREKKGKVNTKAILRSSLNKSSDDVLAMEKKKAQEMVS